MKKLVALLALFLTTILLPAAEDPAHEELRLLRTEIITAITKGDIDTVLTRVHPDVVVTWQNSEVCRGRQGLKDFFDRMGRKSFKGYKIAPTPDELTILHGGDTGISFGKTVAEYDLLGRHYEIESRWTATLVKLDGKWLLGAYHISMNTLDNPLLTAAKKGLYIAGGAGLVLGILIGRILGRRARA
ncbi:MAG: nuclear transport factor 2 family protein [Verrucomicrobiaceae bacterium]|nr:MAG: nuclear transport factor 2 family protein [Verrucomicrobiaceae bacterium]